MKTLTAEFLKNSIDAILSDPGHDLFRAATNESQKTRNKNQETKQVSTFAVSRLRHSETKKNIA